MAQGPGGWSVGNAFSYGFKKFRENLGPLVLAALGIFAVLVVLALVRIIIFEAFDVGVDQVEIDPETGRIESDGGGFFGAALFLSLLLGFLQWVIGQVIAAGVTKGALEITDGRKPELNSMFKGIDYTQVLIASFISGLAVFVGILLCVIPGLIAAFLLSFTTYFVVDKQMKAMDAIKASIDFVRGHVGELILMFLASVAAVVVGACLCGVGLLVAIPVVVIAQAYTFRVLRGEPVVP